MNPVNLLEPLDAGNITIVAPHSLGEYVAAAFPIFLAACVALAIVYIAWGGLEHMLSNVPGAKVEGTKKVKSALWGLVIALAAWILLNTINPKIVNDAGNKVLNLATPISNNYV